MEDLRRKLDERDKVHGEAAGPAEKVGLSECPPPRTLHLLEDDDQVLVMTVALCHSGHTVSLCISPCHSGHTVSPWSHRVTLYQSVSHCVTLVTPCQPVSLCISPCHSGHHLSIIISATLSLAFSLKSQLLVQCIIISRVLCTFNMSVVLATVHFMCCVFLFCSV